MSSSEEHAVSDRAAAQEDSESDRAAATENPQSGPVAGSGAEQETPDEAAPAPPPARAKRGSPPIPPEDRAPVPPEIKEELVSHMKVLRAFAISLCRNGSRADDLVQETVTKAWTNIHSYQPGTNMRAWLFTILRNSFYSEGRKANREIADEDGEYAEQVATKPDHDGRLQMMDFRTAFDKLPDEQREVLILVGALQHSYEDAAEMCGVRVGTVKSRLNRGRARLAELMGLDEDDALEINDSVTSGVVSGGRSRV